MTAADHDRSQRRAWSRRRVLRAAGAGLAAATAGCVGSIFETTSARAPPVVSPRPEGVYVPTHSEEMGMVGTGAVGDLRVRLAYSYPHRFWVVERDEGTYVAERIEVGPEDAVHLMVTPFDPESGQVVPDTGLSVEVYRDGSLVTQETIYRMLSQQMGFHYGANFPLDGDGTYEVRVAVGGVGLRRFGGFEGRFGDPGTASVSFEYSERARNDLPYTLLSDRQGERGALEAMAMGGNPVGRTPESLPGTPLGTGSLDDAQFRAARVADSRLGGDPYLAVVAETPFNRFVLPRMGLSARVGTGDGAAETDLRPALDPALGFHYGASVPDLTADSDVSVTVETPSVVARHEGYETAFLGTGSVALAR